MRRRRRRRCRRSRRRRRRFFAVAPCALLLSPWTSSPCCLRVGVVHAVVAVDAASCPWISSTLLSSWTSSPCCRCGRCRAVVAVDIVCRPWTSSLLFCCRPGHILSSPRRCPVVVVVVVVVVVDVSCVWMFRVCGRFVNVWWRLRLRFVLLTLDRGRFSVCGRCGVVDVVFCQ